MNVDILNMKGEKVGDYTIDDTCLEFDKGAQAVHDAVVAFLAENRAGTASVKTRAEVAGSGKKPFKQKGLGRAVPAVSEIRFGVTAVTASARNRAIMASSSMPR